MVSKDSEEKIQQLQMLEQNIQHFFMQKQQHQAQMLELESAVKELENSKSSYKIVGNIMVAADTNTLLAETRNKLDSVKLRISSIEKQESRLKEKVKAIQKDVMGSMKE